eukprot:Em0005g727a
MGQGDQDHGHDHGSRRQDHGHKETMIMGQGGKIMATRRPRSWVKETKIMAMIMGQLGSNSNFGIERVKFGLY